MVLEKRCENSRIAYIHVPNVSISRLFAKVSHYYAFIRGCFELIREISALLREGEKKLVFPKLLNDFNGLSYTNDNLKVRKMIVTPTKGYNFR